MHGNKVKSDKEILEIIKAHPGENLTVRRLCQLLGYKSSGTVQERMDRLEEKGLIERKIIRETHIEVLKDIQ